MTACNIHNKQNVITASEYSSSINFFRSLEDMWRVHFPAKSLIQYFAIQQKSEKDKPF